MVTLFGDTGVGKSTFTQYLQRIPLQLEKNKNQQFFVEENKKD